MELRQYIYLSKLRGSIGDTGLRQIMQRSREKNVQRDLTGALLFDGESFAQLIEGRSDDVLAIVDVIRGDSRHDHFEPLCNIAGSDIARRCDSWGTGYVDAEDIDQLRLLADNAAPQELPILERFMKLLAKADVI